MWCWGVNESLQFPYFDLSLLNYWRRPVINTIGDWSNRQTRTQNKAINSYPHTHVIQKKSFCQCNAMLNLNDWNLLRRACSQSQEVYSPKPFEPVSYRSIMVSAHIIRHPAIPDSNNPTQQLARSPTFLEFSICIRTKSKRLFLKSIRFSCLNRAISSNTCCVISWSWCCSSSTRRWAFCWDCWRGEWTNESDYNRFRQISSLQQLRFQEQVLDPPCQVCFDI